ncbi:hypothetical protein GLUCORHAEAF1_19080 [Komagataeibacter rhaeticus AF1]|nr:hypothetical protein GLUCORHAEAF1_19080 [Komagataeibacter rhaeticus AF1]
MESAAVRSALDRVGRHKSLHALVTPGFHAKQFDMHARATTSCSGYFQIFRCSMLTNMGLQCA